MDDPTRTAKVWHLLPHDADAVDRLSRSLRLSPVVAQLLLNRQQAAAPQVERFLACPLKDLHEPELLPGVVAAVERLWIAIEQKKKICIYGDYDVDGVTATAI